MAQGMNKLNEALASLPEVRELLLSLDAGTSPIAVSGLSGVHRAQLTAAVRHKTQRPLLIVCADENEANRMAGDLHELLGEDVSLLFAREWQLRDRVFASHGWEQQRIGSLCSLAAGKAPILVATVDGLMQRTLPPDALRGAVTDISLGDRFDLNALSKKLVESGYTRAETVEGVGQFALRGGILDVWSPLSTVPWWDSFTTALSIIAMWMLAHKYVEQWLAWLVVDAVSCGIYIYKDLYFTSFLYGLYAVIACFGYLKWKQLMNLSYERV